MLPSIKISRRAEANGGYWAQPKFERLIATLWEAIEPKHAASKRLTFPKVVHQKGGVVCGTHFMMRVEDLLAGIEQDYSHKSVLNKRREIIQVLLQTTELGWEFIRTFGTTDCTLLEEITTYIPAS